jgi:hypothetical protein
MLPDGQYVRFAEYGRPVVIDADRIRCSPLGVTVIDVETDSSLRASSMVTVLTSLAGEYE